MIRPANESDLPAIDYIYNQAIYAGFCTADLHPVGEERRYRWFRMHDSGKYPIHVYEQEDKILGWAALSPYREGREALLDVAELSYYVDFKYHGQDIGSSLVEHSIKKSQELNKRVLIAIIIDGNQASIGLLEKYGFEEWGFLPEVVKYDGEIRGQFYMGKIVG